MANLRISTIKVMDSTTIIATFKEALDPQINTSNVEIESVLASVPNGTVRKVGINGRVIKITTLPLTPYAPYIVRFKSTNLATFQSVNGDFVLLEDGRTNEPIVLGAEEPENVVRESLLNLQKDNVFNLQTGSLVRDIINSQGKIISRALYDVRQVKNENYLQNIVFDEKKTRGAGPFDRLNEESAFEVIRVSQRPTGARTNGSLSYSSFPRSPVTLQAKNISNEELVAGSGESTFNNLTLTLAYWPVIKVTSITVDYSSGSSASYDISIYGYQLQNPHYDQEFASTLLTLDNNQVKLSEYSVESGFKAPAPGDTVTVSYQYKHQGIIVEEDSVLVSQVLDSIREPLPAISTEFSLKFAPVVDSADNIENFAGVEFLDPNANPPFSTTHPAFETEIPYRIEGLPSGAGEYAIDYEKGRVFVYGAETNNGTGNYPAVATYKYRHVFSSRLDYTYNPDNYELVASPLRELATETAKISYSYEETLVPGEDFVAHVHSEAINERIQNRLISTNSLKVLNSPITNVFKVFNETTGEIYPVTRFSDENVYFQSRTAPKVVALTQEPINFTLVQNELLLVNEELTNSSSVRVFKILLSNNNITSSSADSLASSFNTSLVFDRQDIFATELYYDGQTLTATQNINKLSIGNYVVDYDNGIIYVGVAADQDLDLGTANYRNSFIQPENPHLISVEQLYYSIDLANAPSKRIKWNSFDEGEILPDSFDRSDERFTNGDSTLSYTVTSNSITVTDDIKLVRAVYDAYDLNNNVTITNFANGSTVSANTITLASAGVEKQELLTISSGPKVTVSFISPGAEIASVTSVKRLNDNTELYDASGSFSGYDITLSGTGSPTAGEVVLVVYNVKLNGSATPVVDYSRGDYFVDYTYLADEILVSYEYGDNVLDFRTSTTLDAGDEYYVTYKTGALRDSLLKNFGALIDLPLMNSFDLSLSRENYRNALKGALQSFTKGPTLVSMKQLVSNITKIDPKIIESAFDVWSLGISYLYSNSIDYSGNIQLQSGKFDNGVLITNSDETITFPLSSNLRVEEGTLEMWAIPQWNGLDNDATLTFELLKDGQALSANQIFIGSSSYNPTITDNVFTVSRSDDLSPEGLPSKIYTHTGMFIYFDTDLNKWRVYARDKLDSVDGYLYSGTIISSGEVYDVQFIPGLGEINDVKRTTNSKVYFEFNLDSQDEASPDGYVDGYSVVDGYFPGDGYVAGYSFDGIQFMADEQHYLFDWGQSDFANRFSLFKDGRGYLNFVVIDENRKKYPISADISNWRSGEKHHVAVTWRLNTYNRQDEMHLFIDGFEVPNIMRYGGRPISSATDRFRTVTPEIIAGTVPKNTVTSNDLTTVQGSSIVESASVDFNAAGIVAGDTIHILESGFTTYTILSVSGSSLVLDSNMPTSLSDARFSVNEYEVMVSTQVDLFKNFAVFVRNSAGEETEIPGLRAAVPSYSISKNLFNQNTLTLLGNANAGDQILIKTLGLNHRRIRERHFLWGSTSNIIKSQLPPPVNLDEVSIIPVLMPRVAIGPNNSTISGGQFIATGLSITQPTSASEGRTLRITISEENVDFSTPVDVTIHGTTAAGPTFETVQFAEGGSKLTTNKFKTTTSVDVTVTPVSTSSNSTSVEIKEAYPITTSEGNLTFPVIRYSFKTQQGSTLEGDGSTTVSDPNGFFGDWFINQTLVITSPSSVAGSYNIESRTDDTTVVLDTAPGASFTGGTYSVYNASIGRSGFQNGFFTLETAGAVNTGYTLPEGVYEFDYAAYLEVPISPISGINAYIGSDRNRTKQANAILDELRILSRKLTDVRVGESAVDGEDYITTDFTSLNPFESDSNTLFLVHFDNLPLKDYSDFWISSDKQFIQSDSSVNDNFEKSIVLIDKSLTVENKGILNTTTGSTIEFWVSPRFDTFNDPVPRFYFDASSAVTEEIVSTSRGSVKVSGSIGEVVSVKLSSNSHDFATNYFSGGSVKSDNQTILLGKQLPVHNVPVIVTYIPSGQKGDRISIYKDSHGFLTFNVRANNIDYQVKQSIFWQRDTWHRIMATFEVNSSDNLDEIRLFVDGEERGIIYFGSGLLFGQGAVFGQGFAGDNSTLISDINFSDRINYLNFGSDFRKGNYANARYDNIRISNTVRSPFMVAGQAKDINYSSNTNTVYPVVEDLFTTLLLDFNKLATKNTDFAVLRDEMFGLFDFDITVMDSFDIINNDAKMTQVVKELILALKPAQSRATITIL